MFEANQNHTDLPLHRAARNGDVNTIQKLLAQGEDVNSKNASDETPLDLAISASNIPVTKALVEHIDGKINDESGRYDAHQKAALIDMEINALNKLKAQIMNRTSGANTADIISLFFSLPPPANSTPEDPFEALVKETERKLEL